ncbi:MAG: hypothetical protein ACK2T3_06665, partial [Candidatus Promineifilaceae bacterium]
MDTIYASRTRFHKIMVLFDRPALWSTSRTLALLALMQLPPTLAWWISTGDVQITAASSTAVILFSFSDGLLFWSLTKRGISFGSWKSQTIVIAVMRIMASVIWALSALVIVDSWSLMGLLITQLIASAALYWGTAVEPFNLGITKLTFN